MDGLDATQLTGALDFAHVLDADSYDAGYRDGYATAKRESEVMEAWHGQAKTSN